MKSSGKFEIENALPEKNAKFENCAADKQLKSKKAQWDSFFLQTIKYFETGIIISSFVLYVFLIIICVMRK